jgi:tRNA-uridine 2-sulfurtransferase
MAERAVVAMSGGVDSSVAALLMLRAGYEVVGVTMQVFDLGKAPSAAHPREIPRCCAPDDALDARRVAELLGIPHYVIDHEAEMESSVIRPYVADYVAGRTPSPCVLCNSELKFDALFRRARALGARRLATGHYARLCQGPDGRAQLLRARDAKKDQSYFLFATPKETLELLAFPVGEHTKEEVRAIAEEAGLPTARKPESMETCFVGAEGPAGFVEAHAPRLGLEIPAAGSLIGPGDRVLGSHAGVHHFTVGQRKGLGVATGRPAYVVGLDAASAEVRVGEREQLLAGGLVAHRCHWLGDAPAPGMEVTARIRHRHSGAPARVCSVADEVLELTFERPVEAVAPGQAVVLYEGDRVLGGGWIESSSGPTNHREGPQ